MVLEKAINLFWDRSFNGCSIKELVEVTGVNRFSLYHEFESKEGILRESLNLYRKRYCDEHLDLLKQDKNLSDLLKEFYLSFLIEGSRVFGCYFIHIGTELADENQEVNESLQAYLEEVNEALFQSLIRNNIETNLAKTKADHLLGLYCTAMSFCLIHSPEQRERYIANGISIILNHA